MKKIASILLVLTLALPMYMAAEGTGVGIHPYDTVQNKRIVKSNSNWSLIPYVGFNVFDGDLSVARKKHAVSFPTVGLGAEYSFTPVWSVGAEYKFDRYGARGNAPTYPDTLLNGMMHRLDAYISADLIGLFYPHDKRKIVSLELLAGGGYGWFKNSLQYDDQDVKGSMTAYDGAAYILGGANLEFNLNRTLALGLRADYTYFMRDVIDGRGINDKGSKNNDGIFDIMLNLRIKFGSRERSHVRNIGGSEANLDIAKNIANTEPIIVHDTVIIIRDSIIVRETTQIRREKAPAQTFYVYFNSGKAEINEEGHVSIQQAAERMAEDTSLYAVVIGYCDNTGSDKFNYELGDKRTGNVVKELHNEYQIPSSHLYGAGTGKLQSKTNAAAFGPNRRAAIKLVDKETFEIMKAELEDRKVTREEPVKTLPLSESARREKVNSFKERQNEEVLVEKTTTLAKLARQYYDNTYCWVYIYLANREQIANPNALPVGATLLIPEITEEEQKIGKDQSLALYQMGRTLK
ncbi:MAG: OmpA family protein [Paludibacteraceae bacterium]|nr:OmpA family protein [Paludibacteraceae bacterium]